MYNNVYLYDSVGYVFLLLPYSGKISDEHMKSQFKWHTVAFENPGLLDWILVPACESSHWQLLAIAPKRRQVHVYDSLEVSAVVYI